MARSGWFCGNGRCPGEFFVAQVPALRADQPGEAPDPFSSVARTHAKRPFLLAGRAAGRSYSVKAQIELIPADRDIKRVSCLDRKGIALGAGRHALGDVSSVSG